MRTIVCVRLASIDPTAWLDALGYNLPPTDQEFDKVETEWVPTKEMKRRTIERTTRKKSL